MFGHDHDAGHADSGHDAGHDSEPAVSIFSTFSTKVIGTFIMGFGGGGAIAQYAWSKWFVRHSRASEWVWSWGASCIW